MKGRLSLILIIFFLSIFHCSKNETEDEETCITELPSISEITFGTGWNVNDSTISDTGRTFSLHTNTIFYQIKFDSVLGNWFMIRNEWRRNDTLLFSAVSLIPIGSKRICCELRHYDFQTFESGTYKISVFYYDVDTSAYVEADYNTGVNRTFAIQQ